MDLTGHLDRNVLPLVPAIAPADDRPNRSAIDRFRSCADFHGVSQVPPRNRHVSVRRSGPRRGLLCYPAVVTDQSKSGAPEALAPNKRKQIIAGAVTVITSPGHWLRRSCDEWPPSSPRSSLESECTCTGRAKAHHTTVG
jgi:hypothetical protein